MLYRYFVLIIGASALLIGVQIPNFVTQYQQRLDAQLTEALVYYVQFEEIAERYFEGDMQALIRKHETSTEEVFRAEARPLRELVERVARYRYQQAQLDSSSFPEQVWFVATQADPELRASTWRTYSFNVPLTQQAVITGAVFALLLVLLLDCCGGLLKACARRLRRPQRQRR
ncbi:DUF2937 family protein [Pseudidiomarina sp.]|uniref:DUF2937 family protein n=1 Tax=Pseudidiomarina sp. TaxID=2081707 RepID=UPI00299D5217|nr:DUF2937 family protein [Pseudidiomarina sp.]MDX1705483.1 DUF2937 family protein [Pseudidiomarina sp.]